MRKYSVPQLLVLMLLLVAASAPIRLHAQDDNLTPQFRIQIDVAGAAIDDTKAAEKKKKNEWIELRSRNFLVVGDADLDDIRQAASEAELFRSRFALLFPRAKEVSSVPTRIVVFRDKQSIRQFGPLSDDGIAADKPYLQPASDTNHLALSAGDPLSRDIIREFVHLLTRDSISPVPLWFQEGVSEYFSTYQLDRLGNDRVLKIGLDEYKQKLKEKELISFSVLFSLSRKDFDSMDAETKSFFSAESCVLFDYLLATRHLTATLRMINGMAEGKPAAQSFRDSFKLSMSSFEENFRRQIQFSKLMGWTVNFVALTMDPQKKSVHVYYANDRSLQLPAVLDSVRADVESRPVRLLPEAQAEFYRGDLLFHNDRLEEAEMRLQHAIELDGKLASAFASLGALKAAQHQYALARGFINKALRLDPSNHLSHFYAAAVIQREAMESGMTMSEQDLEDMNASLAQAVKLTPEFVEASEMLAQTQRLLHGDPNASARLLLDGLRRSPGRDSLLMEMARVAATGGEKPTAGWMLHRILYGGSADNRMKEDARELLDQLNLSPDQKTAFGEFEVRESSDGTNPGLSTRLTSKKDRKSLAKAEVRGTFVRGLLTNVDCSKGMTLHVLTGTPPLPQPLPKVDERIETYHTIAPDQIDWVSDNEQIVNAIACGKIAYPYRPVVITYKPGRKGLMMGEPLVVEFLYLPINVETIRSGIRVPTL